MGLLVGIAIISLDGSRVRAALPPAPAPTLDASVFFGGAGSQRGVAVDVNGSSVYATAHFDGPPNLLVSYDTDLNGPAWSELLPGTYAQGLASTATHVFPVGVANPPSCGASDGVGDTEGKPLFARYDAAGAGLIGCGSENYFPYRGGEYYHAARAVNESGTPYVYATGWAEQAGFAFSFPFILAKYDTDGVRVGAVTEPGIVLGTFTGCCPGESLAQGVTEFNGAIYPVGHSRLPGHGEDNVRRPVIMRYDTSLARVWKYRSADVNGFHRAVAGADGFLYAAGHTESSPRDYVIEKFDEAGARQWSVVFGGAGDDALTGVVAVGGRIFAVGSTTTGTAGGADAVLMEIDPATGATLSTTLFGGALDDFANGVSTDGSALFVVGESRSYASDEGNAVGDNDAFLLKYTLNQPPTADAGDDQTVECTSAAGCLVTLDGSGSSDPDNDDLSYTWTDENAAVVGTDAVIQVTVPLGTHTFTLTVDDGSETDTDTVDVTVQDTTAPSLTVELTPSSLSPPNHKLMTIAATVTASDVCDSSPTVELLSITSSEPDNGLGDGDVAGDIQGAAFGTFDTSFQLRAERSGSGNGRTYTVTYRATDDSGNVTTVSATVFVPKGK
jgi:hypothetical protein